MARKKKMGFQSNENLTSFEIEVDKELNINTRRLCFKNSISFNRFLEYIMYKLQMEDETIMKFFNEAAQEQLTNDIGLFKKTRLVRSEDLQQGKRLGSSNKAISADMLYELIEQEYKQTHFKLSNKKEQEEPTNSNNNG